MALHRSLQVRGLIGRLGVLVASSALALGLLELSVRLADLARRQRDAAQQAATGTGGARDAALSKAQLHPFLGYAQRPGTDPGTRVEVEEYRQLKEEEFVVGVFGGSVAADVARVGGDALEVELGRRRAELAGSVRVLDLGMGGYKQPQQLILFSLLLLLGVPIDAAVNLDGFNELALGAGNAHFKVHPLLPHWGQMARVFDLAGGTASMAEVELAATIMRYRRRAENVRGFLDRHPSLRRFEAAKALLGVAITSAEDRAAAAEAELEEASHRAHGSAIFNLDAPCLGDAFACGELATEIWADASLMMAALAAQRGIIYLHVLQPNQYVEGSKSLTAAELSTAYAPRNRWSRAAAIGYPGLSRRGETLRAAGVDFHDLTLLFRDRSETIYKDPCCHYNQLGYRLVAEEIAALLSAAIERRAGEARLSRSPRR